MSRQSRLWLIALLLGAALLAPVASAAALSTDTRSPQRQGYTYEECGAIDAEDLRTEIETLALDVFAQGTAEIDLPAIVARSWAAQGMDQVVDEAVANAVAELRQNTDYWSRFLSSWSVDQARAFAEDIAGTAFASPEFSAALETLSGTVAAELTEEITAMTAQAGSTALLCLQEYVGVQYSTTLYELFAQEIAAGIEGLDLAAAGQVDVSALDIHSKGLTGLSVIIVSQLVRRISLRMSREVGERVAGRIAGRVLGRLGSSLVPLAGWLIGAGLIVWDLVDGANGALPQIEQSLTSPEIKAAIAVELAAGVTEELESEMALIASAIATDMVEEWRLFCTRHPYLCSLPAENETFRVILDTTPVQELEDLSGLVDAYMEILGRVALEDAVATGAFEQMLAAPGFAAAIVRDTASADQVLAWLERAGEEWLPVAQAGVYRHFDPDQLSDAELSALTALGDPAAVAAVAALSPEVAAALLDARPADVAAVVVRLPPDDLAWLVAQSDALGAPVPLLMRDLAAGATSMDALRMAVSAGATATAASVAVAAPESAGDDALDEAVAPNADLAAQTPPGVSPILLVAGLVLLLLAFAGFVILVQNSVKRNKQV